VPPNVKVEDSAAPGYLPSHRLVTPLRNPMLHISTPAPYLAPIFALVLAAACGGRTDVRGLGSASDVGGDTSAGADLARDTASGDNTESDATQDAPPEPLPAPAIPTPPRSAALSALMCDLDNDQLVAAALRGGACLDASVAGALEEAARGFVFDETTYYTYAPTTFGSCRFLRCLAAAPDCEAAQACDAARWGEPCEPAQARCDGQTLEYCLWTGEEYRWAQTQDCERAAARCSEDGAGRAACVPTEPAASCERFIGECNGNQSPRCMGPDPGTGAYATVLIDCDQVVSGGVCSEEPIGGEFPGPLCRSADGACNPAFAEGFGCEGEGTMSYCLFGELRTLRCSDYGYTRCADGGFFDTRCVP
jgi:hypothetical protein